MAVTLDTLKKAVKKNKGRSQALAWLADMERLSGDYEAAMKTVDEALAASPSDVPALLVRAKILTGQQDFAGSVAEYKKVLAKDPFCLSAHKRMGEAYDKLGKTDERNACFRRVHDMDPLDSFWKEEYDVVPEETVSDTMVAPPMDDSSFTMDMGSDAESMDLNGEEDVFANLAASLPNTDEEDNSSMENLLNSLNEVSGELGGESVPHDQTFDENVLSTSEVSSAITGILGGDDDLDSIGLDDNASEMPASPFSQLNISNESVKVETADDAPKSNESDVSLEEKPVEAESNETNVDDAFSSLLGDDEFPDEKPNEESLGGAESGLSLDAPKVEDNPTNVDDAFSSIFGDDELPDEKLAEEQPVEESTGGMFEKSADADFSLNETLESAEPVESPKPAEDNPTNVDDAFSSIFGDDELPDEQPAEERQAEPLAEDLSLPAEESMVEESAGGLFEKSADADFSLSETLEEPQVASPAESVEKVEAPSNNGVPTEHMDFSDDEDVIKSDDFVLDLDETPSAATGTSEEFVVEPAPEAVAENVEKADAAESPVEQSALPEDSKDAGISEDLSVSVDGAFDALFGDEDKPQQQETALAEESAAAPGEDNLANEMGGAFASMFGDDDDLALPEEKKESTIGQPLSEEATGAAIEEESVKESVDDSFNSIFGKDEDLDLPAAKPSVEPAPAANVAEVQEQALETESTPSANLDSLDSEVSNAFKGLFDEDDSLPETDAPNNKGVDYLMSGDSDDEVSASLVNDADAPLSRGAADLDDSLNTRTLADIYMEQGVYNKALEIYSDLAKKNPNNAEIKSRLEEVEKLCREKFGEV